MEEDGSAGDDALQATSAIDYTPRHHRLYERRGRRELQTRIGRQEQRTLIRRDQTELARRKTEFSLNVTLPVPVPFPT